MIQLLNATGVSIPLADESVHCVVTSPPFWGLRDYSLPPRVWGGEPGCGHVWGEKGRSSYRNRQGARGGLHEGRQANKLINGITLHPSTGQFCQRCGAWLGCLGNEPTPALYVQHLVEVFREVRRVLRPDGIVWLNLGDSYFGDSPPRKRSSEAFSETWDQSLTRSRGGMRRSAARVDGLKPKDLCMIPARVALALQADGWWLRSDVIWAKGVSFCDTYSGSSMPASVTDRPATSYEHLFLLSKSARYFYDHWAVREPTVSSGGGGFSESYAAAQPKHGAMRLERGDYSDGRNLRSVWLINPKGYKGAHFAVYPPALIVPCVKAGTSERGVCPSCAAPWKRVVGKEFVPQEDVSAVKGIRGHDGTKKQPNDGWDGFPRGTTKSTTAGWRPSCSCSGLTIIGNPPVLSAQRGDESEAEFIYRHTAWQIKMDKWQQHWSSLEPLYAAEPTVPAIVLDPFVGSGTTLVVARSLGRDGIGLDLSLPYLKEQATPRLALDLLREWGEKARSGDGDPLADLPLFSDG